MIDTWLYRSTLLVWDFIPGLAPRELAAVAGVFSGLAVLLVLQPLRTIAERVKRRATVFMT
jgi:hypothetical protein